MIKHYTQDDLTITWKPDICTHSGTCARSLSAVFKPKERPWIQMENSSNAEIMKVVDQCPSGAISYEIAGQNPQENIASSETLVDIKDNGPILLDGPAQIKYKGETLVNDSKKIALCRCGASQNKPYCDGAHSKIDFEG